MFDIIFLVCLVGVVITLFFYTKEGDIDIMTKTGGKTLDKYNTRDKIIDRINEVIVYKYNHVYWNFYLLISSFTACLVVELLDQCQRINKTYKMIAITAIIFLCLEFPKRYINAHIHKGVEVEVTKLLYRLKNIS